MGITNQQYVERIANVSIGASTFRGYPHNTISTIQDYLKKINLEEFQSNTAKGFEKILDKHTIVLSEKIKALDPSSEYWGSARKALNLFLGYAAYHSVLRKKYRLNRIEKFLEVPLDGQVARSLIPLAGKEVNLPKWETIKDLTPENSKKFQDFASWYAKKIKCTRIQLDVILWRNEKTLG